MASKIKTIRITWSANICGWASLTTFAWLRLTSYNLFISHLSWFLKVDIICQKDTNNYKTYKSIHFSSVISRLKQISWWLFRIVLITDCNSKSINLDSNYIKWRITVFINTQWCYLLTQRERVHSKSYYGPVCKYRNQNTL